MCLKSKFSIRKIRLRQLVVRGCIKNNCVLVNCFTNDNKYGDVFARIDNTITNSCTKFICASTVSLGDRCFDNYFAAIGIILGNSEVTISCAGDAGTQRDPQDPLGNLLKDKNGVPFFDDEKGKISPKLIDINNAIKERESRGHNEFILTKYAIKGFFLSGEPIGKESAVSTIKSAVPQEPDADSSKKSLLSLLQK